MNKISSEVREKVIVMYQSGATKSAIAKKYDISSRSVGRIIDGNKIKTNLHKEVDTSNVDMSNQKNFEGLLPCPYCGGEAKIRSIHFPENHTDCNMKYYVECTKCGIRVSEVQTGFHDWWRGKENCNVSSIDAINYITEVWNTRFKSKRGNTNNV